MDRSDRGKLRFAGDQARWFLDQLVTNQVQALEAGRGLEALLLTPAGRITQVMRLLFTGQDLLADVEPGAAEALRAFFEGRIFTTRVRIEDCTLEFALLSVLGPRADPIVGEALVGEGGWETNLPGQTEHETFPIGSVLAVRVTRPVRGLDLWVPRDDERRVLADLESCGAEVCSAEDFGTLCTIEGVPRFGVDFDAGYLPQEAALDRAVHFSKGCYLGQEAVAMAQRGRIKRRLRHVRFAATPRLGTILHDDRPAGRVTSLAMDEGRGYGIGPVATAVPLGSEVTVAAEASSPGDERAARATVLELPGTLEGPKPPSARELRERLQGVAPAPKRRGRRAGGGAPQR